MIKHTCDFRPARDSLLAKQCVVTTLLLAFHICWKNQASVSRGSIIVCRCSSGNPACFVRTHLFGAPVMIQVNNSPRDRLQILVSSLIDDILHHIVRAFSTRHHPPSIHPPIVRRKHICLTTTTTVSSTFPKAYIQAATNKLISYHKYRAFLLSNLYFEV